MNRAIRSPWRINTFPLRRFRGQISLSRHTPYYRTARSSSQWTSTPRVFPTTGFEVLDSFLKIEEETLPTYTPEKYYPAYQGEIFNDRYQALAKLGYGVTSTVWFACDLVESRYVVLKVYVLGRGRENELNIYNHMDSIETNHPGRKFIRRLIEHFFVDGPNGRHVCLVHELLGFSAVDFLRYLPGKKMSIESMKPAIRQVLVVLDFLHSVAGVVYTDLQLKNLLLPTPSPDALSAFEEREIKRPTARKVLEDRTVYITSRAPTGNGLPLVSDFGEARFSYEERNQDIMPDCYRAPEVVFKSCWDYKVDIWSVAMIAWDIVNLHTIIKGKIVDNTFDDGAHIAELVALLGHPPLTFLKKTNMSWVFWDESGRWKNLVPIPERSLEGLAGDVEGQDVEGFLRWLRLALQWDPGERPTALELLMDPWLMKGLKSRGKETGGSEGVAQG